MVEPIGEVVDECGAVPGLLVVSLISTVVTLVSVFSSLVVLLTTVVVSIPTRLPEDTVAPVKGVTAPGTVVVPPPLPVTGGTAVLVDVAVDSDPAVTSGGVSGCMTGVAGAVGCSVTDGNTGGVVTVCVAGAPFVDVVVSGIVVCGVVSGVGVGGRVVIGVVVGGERDGIVDSIPEGVLNGGGVQLNVTATIDNRIMKI